MDILLNKLFDKHSEGYGVYDRENLIKDICKEVQNLQLQQTGVIKSLPDYELEFCKKCFQMTNHLSNKCQKCKGNVL